MDLGKQVLLHYRNIFFPRLAADKNFLYNPESFTNISKNKFIFNKIEKRELRKEIKKNNVLVSNKSLVDWNPRNWEKAAKKTLDLFGEDAIIVLTIRDPIDYLTSLFVQKIQEGLIISPYNFFVTSNQYDLLKPYLKDKKNVIYDHQSLDYYRLSNIYKEKFKKVYFLPINLLNTLYPFDRIFSLNSQEITRCKYTINIAPRINNSYSKMAKKLTFFKHKLSKILYLKNLKSKKNQIFLEKHSQF